MVDTPPPPSPADQAPPRQDKRARLKYTVATSAIAAVATAAVIFFLTGVHTPAPLKSWAALVFAIAGALSVYDTLRTGRVNRNRLLLFIAMGIVFTMAFSIEHQVTRGSILLSETNISGGNVPICPITIPFVGIPLVIIGKMIFPSTVAALVPILALWLAMTLLLGRGWCGWICFFGWMDQLSASIADKPLIRLDTVPKWAKLFPYAFMLFLILVALVTLFPIYCAWLCPLRIFYDPPAVATTGAWILALVFVIGGFTFLFAGPYLTKKRLNCSFICPLMPANSLLGQVSPFRVKIDTARCVTCKACVRTCEVFAMTEESLAKGEPTIECMKCGRCMDACPNGAIDYRLIGTSVCIRPWFITLATVFLVMLMTGFTVTVVQFILTGHISTIGGV
jgi:polyferredoxin